MWTPLIATVTFLILKRTHITFAKPNHNAFETKSIAAYSALYQASDLDVSLKNTIIENSEANEARINNEIFSLHYDLCCEIPNQIKSLISDSANCEDVICEEFTIRGKTLLHNLTTELAILQNGTITFLRNVTAENTTEYLYNETELSDEEYLEKIMEFIYPKTWTWVLIVFHSAVFVIGLVGNTLVCVSVYRNHTMRTVTNYFIVNLAVADFLVIFVCLPPTVIWDVLSTWFFGTVMCKITLYLQVS